MEFWSDTMVAIFMEIARLLVIKKYCNIFLKNKANAVHYPAYICSYILTTVAYLVFHKAIINLTVTFIGIFIIALTYGGTIKRKLLFSTLILTISIALDLLAAFLFMKRPVSDNYVLISSFISVLLFLLSAIVAEKIFRKRKEDVITGHVWYLLFILITSICTIFVLAEDTIVSRTSVLFISSTLLIFNFVVYYLYDAIVDKYISERENILLREQMNIYDKQLQLNIKNDKQVRSIRHDIKHHMKEIIDMAKNHKNDAIIDYIGQMNIYLENTEKVIDTGNDSIDGILNYMVIQAKQQGVEVSTHLVVPEATKLSTFDMNIIFGNLMENAIEAAINSTTPKIDVSVKYNQGCLFVTIANTYSGKLNEERGKLYTTKSNKKDHGLGLYSVESVVEKYQGTIDIRYDDTLFAIDVVLYNENEE